MPYPRIKNSGNVQRTLLGQSALRQDSFTKTKAVNTNCAGFSQDTSAAIHPAGTAGKEGAVQVLDAVGQHQEDAKVASLLDLVAPLLQDADGVGGEALL